MFTGNLAYIHLTYDIAFTLSDCFVGEIGFRLQASNHLNFVKIVLQ